MQVVSWLRTVLFASLASALVLASISGVQAQDAADGPAFLSLGDDPAGDSDHAVEDILSASIAASADELLVHYALSATSDPAGQYCWAVGYEFGGTEWFPVVCAEFAGGVFVDAVGWTTQVSSSRGTQIEETTGEFVEDGVVLHVPLDAAGLKAGDQIDDVYGLTYETRTLLVEDAAPDAKSDKAADESYGSYVVGVGRPGAQAPAPTTVAHNVTGAVVEANATFANATSETHLYNWTALSGGLALNYTAEVRSGSVDVLVVDGANATAANLTIAGNGTRGLDVDGAAGNWSLRIAYHNFTGNLTLRIAPRPEAVPPPAPSPSSTPNDDNRTGTFPLRKTDKAPGLGVPLLLAATAAAAVLARRRTA